MKNDDWTIINSRRKHTQVNSEPLSIQATNSHKDVSGYSSKPQISGYSSNSDNSQNSGKSPPKCLISGQPEISQEIKNTSSNSSSNSSNSLSNSSNPLSNLSNSGNLAPYFHQQKTPEMRPARMPPGLFDTTYDPMSNTGTIRCGQHNCPGRLIHCGCKTNMSTVNASHNASNTVENSPKLDFSGHSQFNSTKLINQVGKLTDTGQLNPMIKPVLHTSHEDSENRIYNVHERTAHKSALNQARHIVLNELKTTREIMKKKLAELAFSIDPRTQHTYTGFFESFSRLRKFVHESNGGSGELIDLLVIDSYKFSRKHFYNNHYFQISLISYYDKLLKDNHVIETTNFSANLFAQTADPESAKDRYYHQIKVLIHNQEPYLKISFEIPYDNSVQHEVDSE